MRRIIQPKPRKLHTGFDYVHKEQRILLILYIDTDSIEVIS